jgi:hypothetical protein
MGDGAQGFAPPQMGRRHLNAAGPRVRGTAAQGLTPPQPSLLDGAGIGRWGAGLAVVLGPCCLCCWGAVGCALCGLKEHCLRKFGQQPFCAPGRQLANGEFAKPPRTPSVAHPKRGADGGGGTAARSPCCCLPRRRRTAFWAVLLQDGARCLGRTSRVMPSSATGSGRFARHAASAAANLRLAAACWSNLEASPIPRVQ